MREIEFRGKSCDEWVYGHLLKTEKDEVCCVNCESKHSNYLIQTDELDKYNEYGKYYITDDDTIGQYTGMKDKNGVIKAQAPFALVLLTIHIILMYTLGF